LLDNDADLAEGNEQKSASVYKNNVYILKIGKIMLKTYQL
jgi:hypothetical protein